MAKYLIDGATLTAIADAIRDSDPENFEDYQMTPEEMAAFIPDVWQAGLNFAGQITPRAFISETVDDLQYMNPADGSMTLVESDSIVGDWVFNETLDITLEGEYWVGFYLLEMIDYDEDGTPFYRKQYYCGFTFFDGEVMGGLLSAYGHNYNDWYECGDWYCTKEITFVEDTDSAELKNWLKANATKKSTSYDIYIREKGEWVCKGSFVKEESRDGI